ncbi:MAG: hypothetical protein HOM07_14515, partial [Rhodospirillaceae bacterium]|nr:hypothetical protein [Rhodospirillaceae bacterium]
MDNRTTEQLAALDWGAMAAQIDETGYARTGPLLSVEACAGLIALYDQDAR